MKLPFAIPASSVSGFVHCTTVKNFRAIRRDGMINPNLGDRPHQHGVSHVSRCFRLGATSLFDAAEKRSWLRTWLTAHKPLTVAIMFDRESLDSSKLLSCAEARKLTPGIMLPGEVCYRGEIALSS